MLRGPVERVEESAAAQARAAARCRAAPSSASRNRASQRARSRSRRDHAAPARRLRARDARAVSRDRDAFDRRIAVGRRAPASSRAARRPSDARCRPTSRGSRSARRPGAGAAYRPAIVSSAPAVHAECDRRHFRIADRAQRRDAGNHADLLLHRAHELQPLAEIAREEKRQAGAAARARDSPCRSCRGSRSSCAPALRYCHAISHSSGPQPASTVRPAGTQARRLEQDLRRARRHHAGQRPAGDRKRPLERAGAEDHAPRARRAASRRRTRRRSRARA